MAEDKDIKIYVGKNSPEQNEFRQISDGIDFNTKNGNIEKAKQLGIRLAKIKPESDELGLDCRKSAASTLYCIRVLLTFTAEYTIRKTIDSEIIADAVSSSMYGYLKSEEPRYYDNISDGSAFTFYLLALKKDGEVEKSIGEQFAQRCGTSREEFSEMGANIFRHSLKLFTKIISETDFEKN